MQRTAAIAVLQRELPIYAVALACIFAFAISLSLAGVAFHPWSSVLYNFFLFAASWLLVIAVLFAARLFRERPESPFAFGAEVFGQKAFWLRQLRAVPLLALLSVFMIYFGGMKSAIPLFNPFSWDQTFIRWDAALGFGYDPWRILHPLIGYPVVTSALAALYHLWILLIYAGSIYLGAYQTDELLRTRYFVSYFLCWSLVGVALAVLFSSVGPAFMQPLFGDPRFAPLMDYLQQADKQFPVMVLTVQQQLLDWQAGGELGLGRGISAMPSMHISLATLFWLAMRKISARAGWFFGVFALLIFVGSIHTGYHYALDGIVAATATLAIWWIVGRVLPSGQNGEVAS